MARRAFLLLLAACAVLRSPASAAPTPSSAHGGSVEKSSASTQPHDYSLDGEAIFQSIGVGQEGPGAVAELVERAMFAVQSLQRHFSSRFQTNSASCTQAASVQAVTEGTGTVINATIGDGFMRFTPVIIKANPGDTVEFTWAGKNNHSVTESDSLGSCTKSTSPNAFDSGINPPGTKWRLQIPADARGLKFFYCKVGMHCATNGMTGAILTPE